VKGQNFQRNIEETAATAGADEIIRLKEPQCRAARLHYKFEKIGTGLNLFRLAASDENTARLHRAKLPSFPVLYIRIGCYSCGF